mgnify:CR=1 FL=1
MKIAGEILQHKNKKAPFIALFLTIYCVFVCSYVYMLCFGIANSKDEYYDKCIIKIDMEYLCPNS